MSHLGGRSRRILKSTNTFLRVKKQRRRLKKRRRRLNPRQQLRGRPPKESQRRHQKSQPRKRNVRWLINKLLTSNSRSKMAR